MLRRGCAACVSVLAIAVAACSGGATATGSFQPPVTAAEPSAVTSTSACLIGVSWDNRTLGRWADWDGPAIREVLDAADATYVETDAGGSSETQVSDLEGLIAQGARVLMITSQDREAILPVATRASSQGIAVIAYDRLIEDPQALYVTFDNVEVGRLQAQAVLAAAPRGNYVFMKGDQADANSDFLRSGQAEVLKASLESGDIKVVGEMYVDGWDPGIARVQMIRILAATEDNIDAILAENDGMADGIMVALEEHGLAGKVALSGQDGDPKSLNRVALGTQTVDVWKDARLLGQSAAAAAIQLCSGTPMSVIAGGATFDTPGGNTLSSILLKPEAITPDDLADVIDAGWISRDVLCDGVPPGSVPACP